jgi:hypothetical protein
MTLPATKQDAAQSSNTSALCLVIYPTANAHRALSLSATADLDSVQ